MCVSIASARHLSLQCPDASPPPLLFTASTEIARAHEDIARRRNQLAIGHALLEEERTKEREFNALIELERCVVPESAPLAWYLC